MDIQNFIEFISWADRLKGVQRRSLIHDGSRFENSAEHSWHLALAVLSGHSLANEPIQLERALKMALLHDLAEVEVGDTFFYDSKANQKKFFLEEAALVKLLKGLDERDAQDFYDHWLDFEKRECPESRFVAAMDRYLALLANSKTQGHSWKKHGIRKSLVLEKNGPIIAAGSDRLWEQTVLMLEDCVVQGYLEP